MGSPPLNYNKIHKNAIITSLIKIIVIRVTSVIATKGSKIIPFKI